MLNGRDRGSGREPQPQSFPGCAGMLQQMLCLGRFRQLDAAVAQPATLPPVSRPHDPVADRQLVTSKARKDARGAN